MVSKKKKVPVSPAPQMTLLGEPSAKKSKVMDSPGTSGIRPHSQHSAGHKLSKSPIKSEYHYSTIQEEDGTDSSDSDSEEIEEDHIEDVQLRPTSKKPKKSALADIDWPESDLMELILRIESAIPQKDALRFESRAKKLPWNEICFGDYTPEQCHSIWTSVQSRLRGFRTLKELMVDARDWVSKPWTNFYRSSKGNRHPDMPKRSLSTYMLFYMEKKDKVAKENPHLEMTGVSKVIAEKYKNLSEKKKAKYSKLAAEERRIYDEKMEQFYRDHPEQIPKPGSSKEGKSSSTDRSGPQKPTAPFKLFCTEKMRKHQNDPSFNKTVFLLKCKTQWREMPDTKKVEWIKRCLEEEVKYQDEMKTYATEHPESAPTPMKSLLTKEEKSLVEKVAGKPEKPPNSGYSLFSRLMLCSEDIKSVAPKERMVKISGLWKQLSEQNQNQYKDQVIHMLEQYKLEYATYLESLPEDKRAEELSKNKPKQKEKTLKTTDAIKIKEEKVDIPSSSSNNVRLYKGEPEQPPVNVYQLFIKNFVKTAVHVPAAKREKEANKLWQSLPEDEKAKLAEQLGELKKNYIKEFEKFLKRLSQDELKEYSMLKVAEKNKTKVTFSDDSDSNGNVESSSEGDSDSGSDSSDSSD